MIVSIPFRLRSGTSALTESVSSWKSRLKCWIAYGGKIVSPLSLYVTLAFRIAGSAPAPLASGACAVIAIELPGSS